MKTLSSATYQYVALGDSLANGVGAKGNGYPQQLTSLLQAHNPIELHLFATNGQTSTQLLQKRTAYTKFLKQANLITVNIGGNDLRLSWRLYGHRATPKSLQKKRMQLTLTNLANNWNELAKAIAKNASPQAKVIFINLYNPYQQNHPQTAVFVDEANRILQTICANQNFILLDARDIINNSAKNLSSGTVQLLAKDNLHLNEHGYTMIAESIYNLLYHTSVMDKIKNYLKSFRR